MVVNALFFGFLPQDDPHQWVILARQFVMWVVLMISPTPGGSGLSEWLFSEYYGDLVPTVGLALVLAVFWRLISYYLYLLIGAVIVPGWIKGSLEKFRSKEKSQDNAASCHNVGHDDNMAAAVEAGSQSNNKESKDTTKDIKDKNGTRTES